MRTDRAAVALRFVSLVLTGVFAGFLVTVLVLELSLRHFDGPVYTQVRQIELLHLDDLATATLLPALASTALLTLTTLRTRDRTFRLTATAGALLLSVVVITVLFNLPVNADQLHWTVPTPPTNWTAVRDHWQLAHAARTAAAVIAFGLLGAATMSTPHGGRPDRLLTATSR
ncbi:anthrone oxygenase family protein [Kitasatospora sp. NPDC049285]|uniref:anthrone oxygenase family protein n=1 Tax=Kitasatospora sp. NPDC049285 TaxID=3157096 RepID=UPI003446B1BB